MIAAPPRWAHIPGVSYPTPGQPAARRKYRPRQPSGITPKISDKELRLAAAREARTRRNEGRLERWHAWSGSAKDFAAAEGIDYKVVLRLLASAGVPLVRGRKSKPAAPGQPVLSQAILESYERTDSIGQVSRELSCGIGTIYKVFKAAGVTVKTSGRRKRKISTR